MSEQAGELAAALASAEAAITRLSETVDVHRSTLLRVKIVFAMALAGLVLVAFGLLGVQYSQGRINDLQTTLQLETNRNHEAQCAMVLLFLQFESRTTTNPGYTAEQRALQVQAYKTLRQIGADLGCAPK